VTRFPQPESTPMIRTFLLAALCAVLLSSPALAKHRHNAAQTYAPECYVWLDCGFARSNHIPAARNKVSRREAKEARRIARGEAIADAAGFGGPVKKPTHERRRRDREASSAIGLGSGVIRSVSGATAHVAASATGAFQCLVNALDGQGYQIKFMGGWRAHGSVRGSLHPAGLALDINQLSRNVTRPAMPGNEAALANSCGLISGAQWAHGDSGHFQLGGYAGTSNRHYASRRHRHRQARYATR
jgi:hypothetical protein